MFSVLSVIYQGIAGSCGNSVFNFWGATKLFSTFAAFCIRTSKVYKLSVPRLYNCSTFYFPIFFKNYRHPSGYEMVSHCSFICIFLTVDDIEYLLMWFVVTCMYSLEIWLFISTVYVLIGDFPSLLSYEFFIYSEY